MTIATYADLKTAVATWLNRADLTSYIPDFITLGATRIYYGSEDPLLPSQPVRTWSMMTRETPAVSGGTWTLPARYLATIRIDGNNGGSGWSFNYVSPARFSNYDNSSGIPSVYTILNNAVYLGGTGNATVTHDYYQSFAAMSADSDTNALLTAAPGLWLYSALIEAGNFTLDDELAKRSHRFFNSIVTGLNKAASEHAKGSLAMKAA